MLLKDLPIGSKVVDPTWEWEFRTGGHYTGTGEVKPVTWVVVAKNHPEYPENSVTLVTEELIAKHLFDNSTNRGSDYGSNHYGDCGKPNASSGIRKFLNGTAYVGDDSNNYKSFYDAFSEDFKGAILKTVVENKVWNTGATYFTNDRVFIPSQTELGGGNARTHAIGSNYEYFTSNASRIKALAGTNTTYWTRSPDSSYSYFVHYVHFSGSSGYGHAFTGGYGVLPALNLKSETLVSENPDGAYSLVFSTKKQLIKSSDKIQVLSNGEWLDTGLNEPLTKADFEEFGMDDLSIVSSEKWSELDEEFEVITWTYDLEGDKFIEITTDPFSPMERLNQEEEFEVLTWSDAHEIVEKTNQGLEQAIPKLELTVPDKVVRYLISKDKYSYEVYRDSKWISISKSNILTEGMTKIELESIPQEVWSEWFESEAHKKSFDILIGIYSTDLNTAAIRSLTVDYVDNVAPIILDSEIAPDSVHNEYATITSRVKDYEGDKIYFKVLIKKAGSEEFIQVSPTEDWYERGTSNTEIVQAFNYPYFALGLNEVKLVVKDERGAESEWVGNVTYLNTDPTISITHDDIQMTAVIGDEDGDDIAYRLFINDEMLFDYTAMLNTPIEFTQLFDSSILKLGENNEVRLEVKDSHGGEVSETISVLGTYRGLMFKNDAGFYFVNDRGEFLRDLVFDGVLVAGQTSPTRKVTLENRNGFAIKSTKINALEKDFVTGARVEISKTEMPFNPIEVLKIPEVMANLETKDFYVRVVSNRTAHKGAYFYIDAKAEPAK